MSKTCHITIQDEVNVIVGGLHPTDLKQFVDEFALVVPGSYFHPKFTMGMWDGKKKFITDTGKTTLFVVEQIIPAVVSKGYTISITDRRNQPTVKIDPIDENYFADYELAEGKGPIILRQHQVEGVNSLIVNKTGLLIAATGAGKSLCTAAISKRFNEKNIKVLTIVPNKDLIAQTVSTYKKVGIDVTEYSGTSKDITGSSVVSTWQALQRVPIMITGFGCVIVDEAHGAKGKILQSLLIDHAVRTPYRYGVTGTLPKDPCDKLSVHVALGKIRYTVTAADLIQAGVLSDLKIHICQLIEDVQIDYQQYLQDAPSPPLSYKEFKNQYFADYASEKSYLQLSKSRNEWIINKIKEVNEANPDQNIMILVANISFGRKLAKQIPNSKFVNGEDIKKPDDRRKIYDMFSNQSGLVVFATYSLASTGLDIPRIHHLFLVDVGKSFVRIIQSCGRGLRKADDKNFVHIYDICSDFKYSHQHLLDRLKYYKDAKYPHEIKKITRATSCQVDGFD